MTFHEMQQTVAGPVVLKVDRLDANRQLCQAGMQIAPSVHGWPVHRVCAALLQGHAQAVKVVVDLRPSAVAAEPDRRKRIKAKVIDGL